MIGAKVEEEVSKFEKMLRKSNIFFVFSVLARLTYSDFWHRFPTDEDQWGSNVIPQIFRGNILNKIYIIFFAGDCRKIRFWFNFWFGNHLIFAILRLLSMADFSEIEWSRVQIPQEVTITLFFKSIFFDHFSTIEKDPRPFILARKFKQLYTKCRVGLIEKV